MRDRRSMLWKDNVVFITLACARVCSDKDRVDSIWVARALDGAVNRIPCIHLAEANSVVFNHLRRYDDFCGSGSGDGLAVDRHWVWIGRVKASELLSFLIYGAASSQVDEESDKDYHPGVAVIWSVTLAS